MARVVEKSIKKFLDGPVKSTFMVGQTESVRHGVDSVNGYIRRLEEGKRDISLTELYIRSAVIGGINEEAEAIQLTDGTIYFPIYVHINYTTLAKAREGSSQRWLPKDCFFIENLKRPNLSHFLSKLSQLFKEEYKQASNYQFKLGRYVFWLDNFSEGYLVTLLALAKNGDGAIIDYTWIAPLQELLELKTVSSKKPAKAKAIAPIKYKVEAPIPEDTPAYKPKYISYDNPDGTSGVRRADELIGNIIFGTSGGLQEALAAKKPATKPIGSRKVAINELSLAQRKQELLARLKPHPWRSYSTFAMHNLEEDIIKELYHPEPIPPVDPKEEEQKQQGDPQVDQYEGPNF